MRLSFYIASLLLLTSCLGKKDPLSQWEVKGGTPEGIQYSSLDQINKGNVNSLQLAWAYHAGDADTANNRTQIQCNPIIVGNVLYATSPTLKLFALDATTGKELWTFSPQDKGSSLGLNRGVTYWEEGNDKRILHSYGEYLYAVNALDGKPILTFGDSGRVSLKEGLGERAANLMVLSNTPGVIYKNLIVMGSRVHEGPIAAPGHIRAFDVKTGKLAWTFHTIPHPGEEGYETWPQDAWEKIGGANAWCGMSVDPGRGMVFAATGSASFDFYGGNRKGENLFANCVIALDANTGKKKWHFQTVHHDIWDRDLPAPPVLITVNHDNKKIDAVAQVTKSGYVFLFERETGKPLFPIEEVPVPPSDLEGEEAWPTQPIPTKPEPFARSAYGPEMVFGGFTPEGKQAVLDRIKNLKIGKPYIPPSREGTVIFPGTTGGGEWGGSSFDPATGILYVNANETPCIQQMVDVRLGENVWAGISLFRTHCAPCHGIDRGGDGKTYPSIRNAKTKFSKDSLKAFMGKGKGVMPSFAHLSDKDKDAIARYVLDLDERTEEEKKGAFERHPEILFSNVGYERIRTPDGYPAVEPPWGTMNAIDLNKGEILWKVPLGEYDELTKKGMKPTGTENYGGPVATSGNLIFIASTNDEKIRALDKSNGAVLWEYRLPAGGYATPAVYEVDGKQFVVIACGGGKMGTKSGDAYLAFALP